MEYTVTVDAMEPGELRLDTLTTIERTGKFCGMGAELVKLTAPSRAILHDYITRNWGDPEYATMIVGGAYFSWWALAR